MTLEVLSPAQCFASENDASVVFLLRYGDFTMLFCGDMEEKAEQALLQSGKSLQADVLKAAHHGSDSSNSRELIDAVKPQYAVISAGRDRNLLPRSTVLKRFEEAGVVCYRTDLDGTVVIAADGELIEIITETTGRSGG